MVSSDPLVSQACPCQFDFAIRIMKGHTLESPLSSVS